MFLQQRAQAEEEMNRKKEEVLTLFLKDKLQKEERNAAVNLLKLNEGWRSVLRQTRASELRKDLTVLSQTFERQLDGLDSVVKTLERDLQAAERQSAQVRFSSDREQMLSNAKQKQDDLKDTSFAVEQKHKTVMLEIHKLYSDSIAAYHSAHHERLQSLGLEDAERLDQMKRKNQKAVQVRSEEDSLPFLHCMKQGLKDDVRNVKRLQEMVINIRVQLTSSRTENVSVERELTEARDQMRSQTQVLRDYLTANQTVARKQLTDVTMQSDQAVKKLQAVIARGQKEMSALCHVTLSMNTSLLQREALRRNRDALMGENQQLRVLLRQHLDAMTLTDHDLEEAHPLLSVYRAPTTSTHPENHRKHPDNERKHTVIEAVHAAKHAL
ncbi:Dynein regulatory complex subunit 2 [Dissostichus eleginoides]|uniref:Dynein regulatory complex subunit 2 n=1 Tax=Dissostichus eleginoides TaxID=100907 RepID=A0AAD9C371_DISEL|nr:Dynein regulatory complex subunit 2 [Dissostichus eleginoides]